MIASVNVEGTDRGTVGVHLEDDDHPGLAVRFEFAPEGEGGLALVGYGIDPPEGTRGAQLRRFATFTEAQRLPWKRWEQAARSIVASQLRNENADPTLIDLVTRMATGYPDIALQDPRMDSLLHLARVAEEYRANVAAGLRNPSAEIAKGHDVRPETARSWVNRARKAGFLGPAIGPTPGEAHEKKAPTTTAMTSKTKTPKGRR